MIDWIKKIKERVGHWVKLEERVSHLEKTAFERNPFLCEHCHADFYCHIGDNPNAQGIYREIYECRGCKHKATDSWKNRVLHRH